MSNGTLISAAVRLTASLVANITVHSVGAPDAAASAAASPISAWSPDTSVFNVTSEDSSSLSYYFAEVAWGIGASFAASKAQPGISSWGATTGADIDVMALYAVASGWTVSGTATRPFGNATREPQFSEPTADDASTSLTLSVALTLSVHGGVDEALMLSATLRADAQLTLGRLLPPAAGAAALACAAAVSCGGCGATAGCGWCRSTDTCSLAAQGGNYVGPAFGSCPVWAWLPAPASAAACDAASLSATPAATLSVSGSPSVSASAGSSSATATVSPSPVSSTATPSATVTASETASGTATSSDTGSATASPSQTESTSASCSVSPSPSVSASTSTTPTESVTPTPSLSASPSVTGTASASASATLSSTPTVSATASLSASPPVTRTPSGSVTASVTPSPSASPTATATKPICPLPVTTGCDATTCSTCNALAGFGSGCGWCTNGGCFPVENASLCDTVSYWWLRGGCMSGCDGFSSCDLAASNCYLANGETCQYCVPTGQCFHYVVPSGRPFTQGTCPGLLVGPLGEGPQCPADSSPCGALGSCAACTAEAGCGWCGALNHCLAGGLCGPSGSTVAGSCSSGWQFGTCGRRLSDAGEDSEDEAPRELAAAAAVAAAADSSSGRGYASCMAAAEGFYNISYALRVSVTAAAAAYGAPQDDTATLVWPAPVLGAAGVCAEAEGCGGCLANTPNDAGAPPPAATTPQSHSIGGAIGVAIAAIGAAAAITALLACYCGLCACCGFCACCGLCCARRRALAREYDQERPPQLGDPARKGAAASAANAEVQMVQMEQRRPARAAPRVMSPPLQWGAVRLPSTGRAAAAAAPAAGGGKFVVNPLAGAGAAV